MKKIKKSIAVVAALLLMGSNVVASTVTIKAAIAACSNEAFDAMDDMLDWGYSVTQASCMGNAVYAACEGWDVSIEQAMECFNQ